MEKRVSLFKLQVFKWGTQNGSAVSFEEVHARSLYIFQTYPHNSFIATNTVGDKTNSTFYLARLSVFPFE